MDVSGRAQVVSKGSTPPGAGKVFELFSGFCVSRGRPAGVLLT